MGFSFSEDGECIVCGIPTNRYCDSCRRYVCDRHGHEKTPKGGGAKPHVFCRECYEKGKPPSNADMRNTHWEYSD